MKQQGVIFRASTDRYRTKSTFIFRTVKNQSLKKHNLLFFPLLILLLNNLILNPLMVQSTSSSLKKSSHSSTSEHTKSIPFAEPTPSSLPVSFSSIHIDERPQELPIELIPTTSDNTADSPTFSPSTHLLQPQVNTLHFSMPLPSYTSITSAFSSYHKGIDFTAPSGTPVHAAGNGTVIESHWSSQGYGLTVVIDHGNNMKSRYAHLSSVAVTSHQPVQQGAIIGTVGCTGKCTGNHLHFELHQGRQALNPFAYLLQ